MKLQSCLMIRCIASNTINMQELLLKLKQYINTYFPHATINLEINEPYWKYPECNEIIYNLLNDHFITVTELIKHLSLSWHHKKINGEEDAIWNQFCNPEEIFLMPEIEWVHIYTWEEDEEPVIN
jgi:hypothetical protein